MSRAIKQHPVEKLVDAYLKRFDKTSNTRGKKQIIDKAAKLIGIALHNPCCEPAEEVILGRTEDFFLVQLTSMLNGIDVRKWRESLERAKKKLEDKLDNPCCTEPCPDINFTSEPFEDIELGGRENMSISFCSICREFVSTQNPITAELIVEQMNLFLNCEDEPVMDMTGEFILNEDNSISFVGTGCNCEEPLEFNINITGG